MPPSSAGEPPPRPKTFEIVLLGRFFNDWKTALVPQSDIWSALPVHRVTRKRRGFHFATKTQQAHRLVLPVREFSSHYEPRGGWGLFPSRQAIAAVGDKLAFWKYLSSIGLTRLTPTTWTQPDAVEFPAVLKPANRQGSSGVLLCKDATELQEALTSRLYRSGQFVIQRAIAGPEFTLHGIALEGRLVWTLSYRHIEDGDSVRYPHSGEIVLPHTLTAADIADVEALLTPLAYSGPLNIDFKRRLDGRILILEINPRFGGSLFRPQNRADLVAAMGALIANARWLGWQAVMRLPWRTQ